MREGNLLIRASAGTGKTFSLATRYLRLMLFDKVDPAKIVALTFSRAAAQEIYTKILERLWTAASSDENAEKESEEVCKGLVGVSESWDKAKFASLLRSSTASFCAWSATSRWKWAFSTLWRFLILRTKTRQSRTPFE